MLTLLKLLAMKPHAIIDQGITTDDPDGVNMTGSGRKLRWVAKRGFIHDWAIYTGLEYWDESLILEMGDKVQNESNIKKLVECDAEALKEYNH